MHEKALTPYIGMSTHSVLNTKESDFSETTYAKQLTLLDQQISRTWLENSIAKTKDLQTFRYSAFQIGIHNKMKLFIKKPIILDQSKALKKSKTSHTNKNVLTIVTPLRRI